MAVMKAYPKTTAGNTHNVYKSGWPEVLRFPLSFSVNREIHLIINSPIQIRLKTSLINVRLSLSICAVKLILIPC